MSRMIDANLLGLTDMEIIMCDGDYKEALKTLIDKIEHAPTIEPEPRWIPCSEMLPREGVEVVLTDTKGYTTLGHLIKTDCGYKWDAGEVLGEISWWYDFDDWNAWMPLPEPYAERRTDGADANT